MSTEDAARAMYGGWMGDVIDAAKRNDAMEEAIEKDTATAYAPIIGEVMNELVSAVMDFPPMHSGHEGFAILKEEVDELWDEVRAKNDGSDQDRTARMRKEAIQVAAMALRFIHDVCGDA